MNPLLVLICIDILMAISFYLPFSAGDLSVLPIGTMAIAAYSFALYTQDPEASLLTGAAIGFVFGTVAALLGGLLMLRLSGFASALTSFGLVVVIQTFFTNWEPGGQLQGILGIPDSTTNSAIWLVTAGVVIGLLIMEASPYGRLIRAVRADRLAAECVGVHSARSRLLLYTLSGCISALAGVFYAGFLSYISPLLFGLADINTYLVGAIMGGTTTVAGPVVGGVIVAGAPEWLQWLASYRLLVYSLLLLAVLVLRRQGIVTRHGLLSVWAALRALWRRLTGRSAPQVVATAFDPDAASFAGGSKLEVHGLTKSFSGLKVLHGIDLVVNPGETVGIVGPNGAGKTTLLNVVSGVLASDGGRIVVNGKRLRFRSPHRAVQAGLSRTFQNLRLFGDFTVMDNLKLSSGGEAGYWLSAVGLDDAAAVRASSLPYGRQRLVEIARAFGTRPSIVLLDEPTAGMTAEEAGKVGELLAWLRRAGVTTLLIEHNLGFVRDTCDRVVVLAAGRTLAEGSLDEVSADPAVIEAYLGTGAGAGAGTPKSITEPEPERPSSTESTESMESTP